MRARIAITVSLMLCLLAVTCSAQSTSNFQSVSGQSARSYLDVLLAEDAKAAEEEAKKENESAGLWGWGGAPRGSKIVGGELVVDPYYNLTPPAVINNWLGDATVDPGTGNPIYSYVDPKTGNPVYYYMDPKTGKPVYTNVNSVTGEPAYAVLSPFGTSTGESNGPVLPSVFSTNDPWA